MYLELVFRDIIRDDVDFRCLGFADSFSKDVIFDIEEILAVFDVQGDIVVIAGIGAHGNAEAVVEFLAAAHEDEFDAVADAFVIIVFRTVLEVHVVEALDGVQVAAAQQNDGILFRGFGFGDGIFIEIEQRLANGQ